MSTARLVRSFVSQSHFLHSLFFSYLPESKLIHSSLNLIWSTYLHPQTLHFQSSWFDILDFISSISSTNLTDLTSQIFHQATTRLSNATALGVVSQWIPLLHPSATPLSLILQSITVHQLKYKTTNRTRCVLTQFLNFILQPFKHLESQLVLQLNMVESILWLCGWLSI